MRRACEGFGGERRGHHPCFQQDIPILFGLWDSASSGFLGGCFLSNSACLIRPHNALSLVCPPARGAGKHFAPGCKASRRAGRNRLAAPAQWARGARLPRRPLVDGFCTPSSLPCPPAGPFAGHSASPSQLRPPGRGLEMPARLRGRQRPPRRVAKTRDRIKVYPEEGTRRRRARTPALGSFKAAARYVPIKESGEGFRRRQCHCDFPNMWSLGQCLYL